MDSGPIESNSFSRTSSMQNNKNPINQSINYLSNDQKSSFLGNLPTVILWTVVPLFIIGFIAGGFILGAVHNAVLLILVVCLFGAVVLLLIWNCCMGHRSVTRFVSRYPSFGLDEAKDGQYVKITGVSCHTLSSIQWMYILFFYFHCKINVFLLMLMTVVSPCPTSRYILLCWKYFSVIEMPINRQM